MKVPDGDIFLFCGVKQKRTQNELVSSNTVKSKTRRHPLEMAEGDQNETSQQTSVRDEVEEMVNQTSPSVIEIHDSTNECEEEARPNMVQVEEKTFVSRLHSFMKDRCTPIERIPHLGFKQINLWRIYKAVEKLGGYDSVTARRLWKKVYDELGGSPGSTSAATCTRRHYERLVLPFERHIKGEEDKPLPPSKPRKPYKRNVDNKVNKTEGKRKRTQSDREMDSEVLTQMRPDTVCQSETGMHSLSTLWVAASDKHHSDCSQPNRASTDLCTTVYACSHLLQVPTTNPWTANIPSATAEVISPLEKKKRLAQASLNLPLSPQEEDKERPSVIHCSQSPVPTSSIRNCNSSDGSPHPLSSSSSRSSSPLSVSSEDSPTNNQDTPASKLSQHSSSTVKNPSSWYEDKSLQDKEPTGQSKDISHINSQSLSEEVMKSQIKNTAWMPIHKGTVTHVSPPFPLSSSYTEKSFWAPMPPSSFTKVTPKSVQLLRPAPIRPGIKIHQSKLTQQDELLTCTKKLPTVSSRFYQTEIQNKSRTMLSRVPPSQPNLSPSNTTLPTSCVLSGYDKSSRDTRHQPLFHPGFHPGRMRLPQAQLMYRPFPVSPAHSALIGSVGYPYPYPIPVFSAQNGYTLPTMMPVYPHKL